MKLEIDKRDLLNLIGKTQNIVDKRNTMPVLLNILLEAQEEVLRVYATDLEISLTDAVPARVIEKGNVVVSAKSLFEIARRLSDGKITLARKENNWLEIKQGKHVSKIVGMHAEEYPIFPDYDHQYFSKMKIEILREMIDKTIYSVSTDETRNYLNGVYFEVQSPLRMVAMDGHRLALVTRQIEKINSAYPQGVILPRKGLHEIKKIIEALDGDVEFSVEGPNFILSYQSMKLMIRLVEGKFPNFQQFIPQKTSHRVNINRIDLLNCVERVSLLANQKSRAILFHFKNAALEISSQNPEMGDAVEELEISFSGSDIKIGFNARYVIEILSNINSEFVDIDLLDHMSQGVFRPHGDSSYLCVVMPMRI